MIGNKLAVYEAGEGREPGTMLHSCRKCSKKLRVDTKKVGIYRVICLECASEKDLEKAEVVERRGYRQKNLAQI